MHLTCLSAAHQSVESVGHDDPCCALLVPGAVLVARQIHWHIHEQGCTGVHLQGKGVEGSVKVMDLLALASECCTDYAPGTQAGT